MQQSVIIIWSACEAPSRALPCFGGLRNLRGFLCRFVIAKKHCIHLRIIKLQADSHSSTPPVSVFRDVAEAKWHCRWRASHKYGTILGLTLGTFKVAFRGTSCASDLVLNWLKTNGLCQG